MIVGGFRGGHELSRMTRKGKIHLNNPAINENSRARDLEISFSEG